MFLRKFKVTSEHVFVQGHKYNRKHSRGEVISEIAFRHSSQMDDFLGRGWIEEIHRITLLHPSRGRAKQARLTRDLWMADASNTVEIEHILSLDRDDPQLSEYKKLLQDGSTILVNENKNVVQATNAVARVSNGSILIYLSDDFRCPRHWDVLIIDKIKRISPPWLLKVHDCLQKFHVDVLTIPIMHRVTYTRLGYFWHPAYDSMFVDQDLYHTVVNNGWLVEAQELEFPHLHYSVGKAPRDATYRRSDSHWNTGKATYHQRKAQNFPHL